jgi:hypothetical protein
MRSVSRIIGVTVMVAASLSCGSNALTGSSPVYLVVDSLTGASGAAPSQFGATVASDVLTCVSKSVNGQQGLVPTVYTDPGQVRMHIVLKDLGSPTSPNTPTQNNEVTITRFHVDYVRSDGRSTQGLDVPFSFDGAVTATVGASGATLGFDLVRLQAKLESPLLDLVGPGQCGSAGGAIAISTIAQVTFYGTDHVGNAVSVTGSISVTFSNWGDPS